ncbi:MAG: beta-galactosidase [Eubacteriales bacterium]
MNKIKIGAWYPVDLNYLDSRHIDEIAESGINLIFAGWGDESQKKKILELCGKAGIDVLLSDQHITSGEPDAVRYAAAAANYSGYEAYAGNMFADEPGAGAFSAIAERVKIYNAVLPEKTPYINLFPIYAPLSVLGTESYEQYVEQYAEIIHTDYISVDIYPFSQHEDGIKHTMGDYFRNLDIVATVCRKHARSFRCFIQTMGFNVVMRPPTEAEMRYQVYACLSFGADGIFHFCYATPPSGAERFDYAMIGKDGKKTELWYSAKTVNSELNALSEVYMRYKNIGAYLYQTGEPGDGTDFDNKYDISKFGAIQSLESDETLLIGFFSNENSSAFTLLNASEVRRETSATVKMRLNGSHIIIYRRGIPETLIPEDGLYTVNLEPCGGVFITVK